MNEKTKGFLIPNLLLFGIVGVVLSIVELSWKPLLICLVPFILAISYDVGRRSRKEVLEDD